MAILMRVPLFRATGSNHGKRVGGRRVLIIAIRTFRPVHFCSLAWGSGPLMRLVLCALPPNLASGLGSYRARCQRGVLRWVPSSRDGRDSWLQESL